MSKFLIWGTGNVAKRCYEWFSRIDMLRENEIIGYVSRDKNNEKIFQGKPVITPLEIKLYDFDYICIWSTKYEEDIIKQITEELHISRDRISDIFAPYKQKLHAKYLDVKDKELQETLEKMDKRKWLDVFYYERKDIQGDFSEAFYDADADLYYILFEGKRMYLARNFNRFIEKAGKKYVGDMWSEQDGNSPHLYEEGDIVVEQGDVLVDAGVCEGNFSLHNIDKVKKVYLIECDKGWMEALHYTFLPYKSKVVFCNKILSDSDSDKTICLDTLITEPVNFIKMDIEGEEAKALTAGHKMLKESQFLKCAISSYHQHGDDKKITQILEQYGFQTQASKGYMLFLHDPYVLKNPEFRRGVIRGIKR